MNDVASVEESVAEEGSPVDETCECICEGSETQKEANTQEEDSNILSSTHLF